APPAASSARRLTDHRSGFQKPRRPACTKFADEPLIVAQHIRTRDGGRWGLGAVHQLLTRSTYTGRHEFNRRGKDRKLKPKSEAVVVDVPPIIDQETFDGVQAQLQARNPKKVPPRVVSGPTLLTGLIHCAKC